MTTTLAFRLDLASGELAERRRTPQGGLIAKANLTRTGVFTYRNADGTSRRELRHPDEVMHPDSLATYAGAPVTIYHPGRVTPDNWKTVTVGHVGHGVHAEGGFVAGEVHLQDADAIGRAESGEIRELSCGYTCEIDPTPGLYQGQPYDVAQKNIKINHVAAGPAGWGRMGPETRMHLDSAEAVSGECERAPGESFGSPHYVRADAEGECAEETSIMGMTNEEKAAFEKATADAKLSQDALEKANANLVVVKAENEMLKLQSKSAATEGAATASRADADFEKRVEDTIQLRADARMVFASADDPEGKSWKHDGKSTDQIRREIVKHLEPRMTLVYDGKELEGNALRGVYDLAVSRKRDTDKSRLDALEAAGGKRRDDAGASDDPDQPSADEARKAMLKRKTDAWRGKGASKPTA